MYIKHINSITNKTVTSNLKRYKVKDKTAKLVIIHTIYIFFKG